MGYFPNGSAGEAYEARYCDRCVHQGDPDDGPWCVVWTLHLVHNYDQLKPENALVKETLDALIPRTKDGLGCDECRMFVARIENVSPLPIVVQPNVTWQAELKLWREINRLKASRQPCEYWTEGRHARCSDCIPCVNAGAINDEIRSKRRTLSELRQAMQRAADRLTGRSARPALPERQAGLISAQRKVLDDAVYRPASAEEVVGQRWRDYEWFQMMRPHVSDGRLWVRVDPLF